MLQLLSMITTKHRQRAAANKLEKTILHSHVRSLERLAREGSSAFSTHLLKEQREQLYELAGMARNIDHRRLIQSGVKLEQAEEHLKFHDTKNAEQAVRHAYAIIKRTQKPKTSFSPWRTAVAGAGLAGVLQVTAPSMMATAILSDDYEPQSAKIVPAPIIPEIKIPEIKITTVQQGNMVQYIPIIYEATQDKKYIQPEVVLAVIGGESSGDPHAISSRGAAGIAQFVYGTANQYKEHFDTLTQCKRRNRQWTCNPSNDDRFNPQKAIPAMTEHLEDLNIQFAGYAARKELALAAYNGGSLPIYAALRNIDSTGNSWKQLSWQEISPAISALPDTLIDASGKPIRIYKDEIVKYVPTILAEYRAWKKVTRE